MNIGVGLKCPYGHIRVQTMVGKPVCPTCGTRLVSDENAPNTALNRVCKSCGISIAFNVYDTGKCPKCDKPWK